MDPRDGHFLSDEEVIVLHRRCYPQLERLNARYAPGTDIRDGFPDDPIYLDLLRTGWLVDRLDDRPRFGELVDALGYALGLLLAQDYGLRWCALSDDDGAFVSMVGADGVSLPPFAYVAHHEHQKSGDLFVRLFAEVVPDMFAE